MCRGKWEVAFCIFIPCISLLYLTPFLPTPSPSLPLFRTLQDASREASPPGLLSSVIDDGMDTKMSSLLTSQLLQGTAPHHPSFSQFLMVVTLVAIFFVNPLSFMGASLGVPQSSAAGGGSMRTLNTLDSPFTTENASSTDTALYVGLWVFRILIASVCFGWMSLKSMPKVVANSNDAVRFWRFRKQAENDLLKVKCTVVLPCIVLVYLPLAFLV